LIHDLFVTDYKKKVILMINKLEIFLKQVAVCLCFFYQNENYHLF